MWIESEILDSSVEWRDTKTQKYRSEPILYNIQHYKQIYFTNQFTGNEDTDYWYIALGEVPQYSMDIEGNYIEIARFDCFEDVIAEFDKLTAALKAGQNYYKIGEGND